MSSHFLSSAYFFLLPPLLLCLLIPLLCNCHTFSLCSGPKDVCTKFPQNYYCLEYYYGAVMFFLALPFNIMFSFAQHQWWKCIFILQIHLFSSCLRYLPFLLHHLPLFPFIFPSLSIFASVAAWAGSAVWHRLPSNVGGGGWQPHLAVYFHLSSAVLPAGCQLVQRW